MAASSPNPISEVLIAWAGIKDDASRTFASGDLAGAERELRGAIAILASAAPSAQASTFSDGDDGIRLRLGGVDGSMWRKYLALADAMRLLINAKIHRMVAEPAFANIKNLEAIDQLWERAKLSRQLGQASFRDPPAPSYELAAARTEANLLLWRHQLAGGHTHLEVGSNHVRHFEVLLDQAQRPETAADYVRQARIRIDTCHRLLEQSQHIAPDVVRSESAMLSDTEYVWAVLDARDEVTGELYANRSRQATLIAAQYQKIANSRPPEVG
ncbi:hypothetical protein [Propionimicrobium sp. PCR01-08-3]|uniref:hypothetical protein n=1 Tax=Propionimicrobium sp. PCR01-08-3 TaxID=3052086 RepID=UPI00255C31CB|nr:hypothetical protein [Propionimicrobium sp. PCR01-08-3]WIY83151.1 hypothetical protein QQ658_01960 [Propionimicrobium sp. PCR01-08-3]